MDWKNEYCSYVHTIQSNPQIQGNPYENANDIFHRAEQIILIVWNHKRPQTAKAILRKKIHTYEKSAIRKSEISPFVSVCMDLEGLILNEIRQRKTNTI